MINFCLVELYLGISRNDGQIDQHSKKNAKTVLFIAADLGHYIADAHMPYTRQSRWTTYGSKRNSLFMGK
jgi:hypothetical protein